ncbi:binding partner of ACD11 1-like [Neltuma alba]|uniref:binding partner of ACD11 1-like n=1 Tax=Neltuma alba TaxID=207710 RepID=UPI0010A34494|nr:binding partner of ACD11 1-like [Prosopis alba]
MSAPVDHTDQHVEAIPQSTTATPNWTNNISDVKTVKVSNLSLAASEMDVREFFSSSGDIRHVEMKRENESTQIAYVTFKESRGAETASLLTGAKIADLHVSITLVEHYQLPQEALPSTPDKRQSAAVLKKAEDVASLVLAKGINMGKDALNRAKSFDERHHLISNASATVASIDQKMGLSDKFSIGTSIVNEKVREMDEKFQVSEKAKSALAVAGPKASNAVSAVMSNPYVSSGASYLSRTFSAVAKAAGDVGTMTKEKGGQPDVETKEIVHKGKEETNDEAGSRPVVPVNSADDSKPAVA